MGSNKGPMHPNLSFVENRPLTHIISTRDKLGAGHLSLIQWSLSTMDKLGAGHLYSGSSLSTRDRLGAGPLSLIQWSLSTRDKLGLVLYNGASLQGTSWQSFVPYTVEPLYKGQLCWQSFVPCTVEPLYNGMATCLDRLALPSFYLQTAILTTGVHFSHTHSDHSVCVARAGVHVNPPARHPPPPEFATS